MSYVKRDSQGQICAISLTSDEGFEEKVDPHSEEYLDFLNKEMGEIDSARQALNKSDAEIARVTEDLIYLLMEKQVILFTELPSAVQEKLLNREKLRESLRAAEPTIIDDEGSI